MVRQQVFNLQVGDRFAFSEDGDLCTVEERGMIDYHGDYLLLYRLGPLLFGHPTDHTPVWVLPA